jgi:hypothetical protein
LQNLAFLADPTAKINELNIGSQDKNKTSIKMAYTTDFLKENLSYGKLS